MLNVDLCDLLVAFRLNKPRTGKGTDQTVNYARFGKYDFNSLEYKTPIIAYTTDKKPVIVVWDLSDENLTTLSREVKNFIKDYVKINPKLRIMFSGYTLDTYPKSDKLIESFITTMFTN